MMTSLWIQLAEFEIETKRRRELFQRRLAPEELIIRAKNDKGLLSWTKNDERFAIKNEEMIHVCSLNEEELVKVCSLNEELWRYVGWTKNDKGL